MAPTRARGSSLWLLLLPGCAHFEDRPLSPAQTAEAFEERTLDDPGLKAFLEKNLNCEFPVRPLGSWDPQALTLAAFYYHPSLELARAQWGVAKAGLRTAGGRPNPTLSVVPGYVSNSPAGTSPWFPSVTIDVPVETANKRGHRLARAEQLSAAARFDIATAAWRVQSGLRAALLEFSSALRLEALLRQQLSIQQGIVLGLEERLRAGAIAAPEVATARIALERIRLAADDARRRRSESLTRVADAVGVPVSALSSAELEFDWTLPDETDLTSEAMRRHALTGRADVLAALAEYAGSQAALELEIAKQYPDVRLGPGYQYDQGEHKWSLGLSVELPLLNQNQGPIAEAQARRAEAAASFEALEARVIGELDRAVAAWRNARERVASLEALLAAQRRQETAVSARFAAGAADRLELLASQAETAAGELLDLDGRIQLLQALGQLEDSVQRPFAAVVGLEEGRNGPEREEKA